MNIVSEKYENATFLMYNMYFSAYNKLDDFKVTLM